jgi:transcriptional regulator with PAS, ATPase and Fis domain
MEGAFTGASRAHVGLFEQADGGTLFLDEVGEMPLAMQAAILRALETGEIRPVGDSRARRVDVRVVAATHQDLASMVRAGTFRADLSYRIAAATISIPPLRHRAEDVLQLAQHFLAVESRRTRRSVVGFEPEALEALAAYGFPGNVRELRNEIARAVALTPEGAHVAATSFSEHVAPRLGHAEPTPRTLKQIVERAERYAVELALLRARGSVSQAARDLGLSRTGLYKVMLRLSVR